MRSMLARNSTFGDASRKFRRVADIGDLRRYLGGGHVGRGQFYGLAPALPSPEPGRPENARDLYRGHFDFANHLVECQPSEVFSAIPPSVHWADALHGFSWLADLAAPDLNLYRAFARSMVQTWWTRQCPTSFAASCNRLKSWSRHAGFLLAGASGEFHEQFFHAVTAESRRLAGHKLRDPAERLQQAIGLLTAALAFRHGDGLRNDAISRTAVLAPLVVLADGGHIDRSPKSLLELLADLVPLRTAMENLRIVVPHDLNAAIERGLPMLRMLCHGDGGLAVFHGVEQTSAGLVRAVLECDRSLGRPLPQAFHSGYCRMSHGPATVIADCGAAAICDSALAFEFSDGPQRIVGSCGIPAHASPAWRDAARRSAAHSTVEIEGHSGDRKKSLFASWARRKPACPIVAEMNNSPAGTLISARNSARLEHRRELFLAANGGDFRGEDSFEIAGRDRPDLGFTIRFHLHPAVKASVDRKGSSIMLLLPNRTAWKFSSRGGAMSLEESIYLASSAGPRGSQQIVIRGMVGRPGRVNWAFRKLARKSKSIARTGRSPRLPF